MLTCALQSGSNGNCIYVETADARLLIDAGISGRQAAQRLARHERDMGEIDALLISHGHRDHVHCAGVFHRRYRFPVHMTAGAWDSCRDYLGRMEDVRIFARGARLCFGDTLVETISTAHDGIEGVAFVVSSEGRRLGIFTDLGHRFAGLDAWIADLDAVYLESNYDPDMLAHGPYPPHLKARIRGAGGHLSNQEAGELLRDCRGRLRSAILSHLSEHNNTPQLAEQTVRRFSGAGLGLSVASRSAVTDLWQV